MSAPAQVATLPPSSFSCTIDKSASWSEVDSTFSNSSKRRTSSGVTLATIYSMYGNSTGNADLQPTLESSIPVAQAEVHELVERPHYTSIHSTELPYATPDSSSRHVHLSSEITQADGSNPATVLYSKSLSSQKMPNGLATGSTASDPYPTKDMSTPPVEIQLESTSPSAEKQGPIPSASASSEPPVVDSAHSDAKFEDPDSSFIRRTYARLDSTGVSGDGYAEGVELTRARLNAAAVPDGLPIRKMLNPAELQVLRAVDRYGFFSEPTGERRVMLPKCKRLSRSTATVSKSAPLPPFLDSMPPTVVSEKEAERISKWERMVIPLKRNEGTWQIHPSKGAKLRKRVYKGIPDRWRSAAWDLLMSRRGETSSHGDYQSLLETPSDYDIQIDLDVPRTISGHVMFRTRYGLGQRSLFHVLHCFSLHCQDCGYCQGMGSLAATFLSYVDPEKAHFWLCQLHDLYSMDMIFRPGFPGLLENIYIQERIVRQYMPGVYEAFKRHNISTTSYATKWYITLFANTIPFQTQLRLWDVFLLEGLDAIVVMAVYIVWCLKENIISRSASFETILSLLSSFFVCGSEDESMDWISNMMSDKDLRAAMAQWRKEWSALVKRGEEMTALL